MQCSGQVWKEDRRIMEIEHGLDWEEQCPMRGQTVSLLLLPLSESVEYRGGEGLLR